jgi:hypothetical protein
MSCYECPRCIAREIVLNMIEEALKPIPFKLESGDIAFAVGKKYKLQNDEVEVVKISKNRNRLTFILNGERQSRPIDYNYKECYEYVYPYEIPIFKAINRNKYKMEDFILKATEVC